MPPVLPPRSVQLVTATPLHWTDIAVKCCIEAMVYRGGHAAIAVSKIEGRPPNRRIVQADSLPLNSPLELRDHVLAVLDRLDEALRESPHEQ